MSTKLTLTLDKETIVLAKRYAKSHNTSLSKIVEGYFKTITMKEAKPPIKIPPITSSLSGIASVESQKSDKDLLRDALNRKFL